MPSAVLLMLLPLLMLMPFLLLLLPLVGVWRHSMGHQRAASRGTGTSP